MIDTSNLNINLVGFLNGIFLVTVMDNLDTNLEGYFLLSSVMKEAGNF